jgi:KipI family sensor histidine kinase inhibitor
MRVQPFGDDAVLVELDDLAQVRALDEAVRAARASLTAARASLTAPRASLTGPRTSLTAPGGSSATEEPDDAGPDHCGPDDVGSSGAGQEDRPDEALSAFSAIVDQVPAARSLLLRGIGRVDHAALALAIQHLRFGAATAPTTATVVELPVTYDGPDLAEVAELTGMTVADVVARHTGATYTVAFGGFIPGFAYLVGLDPALRVPRRPSPRERVPAGSVAMADEFTAVYPAATPGGWRLLGTCTTTMWDLDRDPPALLTPGTSVRFVAVRR